MSQTDLPLDDVATGLVGAPAAAPTATPAPARSQSLQRIVCGMTQKEISRAISFARIVLIIGLVFIHYEKFPNSPVSGFDGLDINAHVFATWVGSSMVFFFFSVVPMLSMVSGWLFFSFKPEDAWTAIKRRMSRRFTSLYLPLVAWNAFYLACIYAFFLVYPHHPFLDNFEYTLPFPRALDFINAIFGVTHRPIAFQFWFVRDLFVTALISPVIWLSIRYAPWLAAAVLCLAWLKHSHLLIFWRADVPFFFYLGALVRQRNFNLTVPLRSAIVFLGIYIFLVVLRPVAPYAIDLHSHVQTWTLDIMTSLTRLVGVVGCWGLMYRMAQTQKGQAIGNYGGLAFFLHSAHWPLLVILKVWLWPLMPGDSDAWMLVHYLLCVSLTVVLGLGLGYVLSQKTPRFFSLMNGGRLLGQTTQ